MVVWNPLTAETQRRQKQQRPQSLDRDSGANTNHPVLEIPGLGVSGVRHGSLERPGVVRGHRNTVERAADDGDHHQQGLASTFQLTGSGISSSNATRQK